MIIFSKPGEILGRKIRALLAVGCNCGFTPFFIYTKEVQKLKEDEINELLSNMDEKDKFKLYVILNLLQTLVPDRPRVASNSASS